MHARMQIDEFEVAIKTAKLTEEMKLAAFKPAAADVPAGESPFLMPSTRYHLKGQPDEERTVRSECMNRRIDAIDAMPGSWFWCSAIRWPSSSCFVAEHGALSPATGLRLHTRSATPMRGLVVASMHHFSLIYILSR